LEDKIWRKKKLPDAPGVYFFLGKNKRILYIGRATSLRNRVRSYFNGGLMETRGPWVSRMLPLIQSIEVRKTDSVLEAILLEADLIKKFQPPYNTSEKDDKSFNCIVITKEAFPQVLLIRKNDINFSALKIGNCELKIVYGPFPNGFQLLTAMKIIRRIFPYRDSKCKLFNGIADNPCFNRQIGLCPGTCTGEISKKEYGKIIRNLRLFFQGKKSRLLKLLQKEMVGAARRQEFEKAGELKRQLFSLKHIQDVALLKRDVVSASVPRSGSASVQRLFRIEAYDLSHFGGKEIVGAMTVVEDGIARPGEYRLFKMRDVKNAHETRGLKELLRRRFNHPEWKFPDLIVVDGNVVQKRAAEEIVRSLGRATAVIALVKDEKHQPRELLGDARLIEKHRGGILLSNSEAHRFALKFQRKRRSVISF